MCWSRISQPVIGRMRSSNAPKAVEYLQRASEQAIERSANAEALAQLTFPCGNLS
jgi:hypothetical protein